MKSFPCTPAHADYLVPDAGPKGIVQAKISSRSNRYDFIRMCSKKVLKWVLPGLLLIFFGVSRENRSVIEKGSFLLDLTVLCIVICLAAICQLALKVGQRFDELAGDEHKAHVDYIDICWLLRHSLFDFLSDA